MTVVYAETNFILELAYQQEQHASCEHLVALAETGHIRLVIPAFSFMEARSALAARGVQRRVAHGMLAEPVRDLRRSVGYQHTGAAVEHMLKLLLMDTTREEKSRLGSILPKLLRTTELIPLDPAVLGIVAKYQEHYDLTASDAAVCASVMTHLEQSRPSVSCFLNRNVKDFDDPGILRALKQRGCRLITRFDQGLGFVLNLP